jgi:hypothetical protein
VKSFQSLSTHILLLLFASATLLTSSARAADISVAAPATGSVVPSPFVLQATSTSCLSQPTASMAYSLDNSTDTVFNPATSINTNVSTSRGTHTLHVKSWGNGTFCEKDIAITVGSDIGVTSPINGSTVPSTFLLKTSAPTCGGQNTVSMTYSFDSQPDNPPVSATSMNQDISTTAGSHLLRVKAWGNSGAFCETDLSINVSSQSVVISTPTNNATVSVTFQLQAQAPACNGKSTNTMAYNFAGHPDTTLPGAQSIDTQVTAPVTGVQQLNVKAWNGSGDLCETSVSVDAENTGITISQPTDPNVAISFPLAASSSTCQGGPTSSMTYSFDSLPDHTPVFSAQSFNTTANAPSTGAHLLHVKAWNTSGVLCEQDVSLNVIESGIVWPSNVSSFSNIEELPAYTGGYNQGTTNDGFPCDNGATTVTDGVWLTQRDCGTNGGKTGTTSTLTPGPGAPPTNTKVREYKLATATVPNPPGTATPGIRWSSRLTGADVANQHFGFDAWIHFENDGSIDRLHALELDVNQVTSGGTLYIMSHQCNFDTGFWQVGGWQTTDQHCDRTMFSADSWHHVQIKMRRDTSPDQIVFEQVAVDGVVQNLTCGGNPCTRLPKSSNWSPAGLIVPNFQIDANQPTSTGITAYVDSFYIYYWPN